jgi:hypothetical protein
MEMCSYRLCSVVSVAAVLTALGSAKAQTVIFDDSFDTGINTGLWNVVVPEPGIDQVTAVGGNLRVVNSGNGSRWAGGAGLWSKPEMFPLITRPTDDTEYNVYFEGISLPSQIQRFAVGLYSTNPPTQTTPKFPDDNGPNGGTSYYFQSLPNSSTPTKNWLSTFNVGVGGAAADSTGGDGFHTWEFGKTYDLRLQVNKDDVTWFGRDRSLGQDWLMLQDPDANILGHPGTETNGRNEFGLFVQASSAGSDNGVFWQDSDVSIERIYATKYKPSPQVIFNETFSGGSLDQSKWDQQIPEPGAGDNVLIANGKLNIVNRNNGSAWAGGVGIYTEGNNFPSFTRPTQPGEKLQFDFIGVQTPNAKQRFAFGLSGINPPGNPGAKLPDADTPDGGLAYAFQILPDNDVMPADSNNVRTKVIGDRYAGTDNFHHAWIWMYPEIRDFRIEVTRDEVIYYVRKSLDTGWRVVRDATEAWVPRPLTAADNADGYWRQVYDPGIKTGDPYDGTEPNGRNLFGIFVHGSSAGNATGVPYQDANFSIDQIMVTRVTEAIEILGDLNGDGFVGIDDLNLVLGAWNQSVAPGDPLAGDPSGDGFVGIEDLNVVLGNWNGGTPPPSTAIPEPASTVSFVLSGAILAHRRRRRCYTRPI